MKIMKKTLLGVGAVSALAIAIAASEFDWHLDLMRENPLLFLKAILNAFVIYGSSAFIGGVLLSIAMCNSWVKRVFDEELLFIVFSFVGLCFVFVFVNSYTGKDVFHVFKYEAEVTALKYRMAAERGEADAQYRLGNCYAEGKGVEKNDAEAVKWYRKAAEQGNVDAQYWLGSCYSNGDGVETNKVEAVRWFRKAAEQGHADAQYFTGKNYELGIGVVQDKDEAEKWFGKIKHPFDQYRIGNMLLIVKQDKPEAVKWLQKAAKQGHEEAKKALTKINNPEKPACPSDLLEPQSDRQDKTFPKVVTLGQTNTIRDVKQDKTLQAARAAAPLFAGAMSGKTPRARAGKGLLGIGALGLSTWLRHKADENRKEAERLRKEAERLNEERWNEKINGGKEDGLEIKYTVD